MEPKQLLKRISLAESRIVDLYHKVKNQLIGPQGAQGVQGIAGPPGPVGPAGLEWQGAWNEDTSYAEDDAVGYDGASWFCISAVTGTNNDSPDNDTEHWALLASQGAQGIQGVQGPQGPAGPSGATAAGTSGGVAAGLDFPYPLLQYTINRVFSADSDNLYRVVLPSATAVFGQKVIVACIGSHRVSVKAVQVGSGGIYINGRANANVSEFYIYPNETYEFTYGETGRWLSSFQSPNSNIITNTTTSSLSLSTLNSTYAANPIETKVFCPNITGGGLVYTKTGGSTWVSQPITTVS